MRQIQLRSVHPLWHTDWWDGPLSGFCLYRDKPFHFSMIYQDKWDRIRLFGLFPLDDDTFAAHARAHEDFRESVGCHCDYANGTWERSEEKPKSADGWDAFYAMYGDRNRPGQVALPDPKANPARLFFAKGNSYRAKWEDRSFRLYDKRQIKLGR